MLKKVRWRSVTQAPTSWMETISVLAEIVKFTYSETLVQNSFGEQFGKSFFHHFNSRNGVCTTLALSNAITNLCGQIWRLEHLPVEKKSMWQREIEWLISVSDHIVDLITSLQTFPDGSKSEVMASRPRSDLYINLRALRKLDNMLLEILDSFEKTEFWYVDQGVSFPETDKTCSWKGIPNHEDK